MGNPWEKSKFLPQKLKIPASDLIKYLSELKRRIKLCKVVFVKKGPLGLIVLNWVYLTINGKTLLAEIVNGEGLEFSVMDPKPLASSPQVVGQNPNAGFHKLAIHATDCESLDFAVVFNNYDADYDKDNLS